MIRYTRITKERTPDKLQPDLLAAIYTHLAAKGLEDEINNALMSIETASTKHVKKLLRQWTETDHSGVILTPKWLIYAIKTANEKLIVLSGRLANLNIEAYEKSPMHAIVPDTGLNISGFNIGESQGIIFIGLGTEVAAQKFRDQLSKVVN